jgi:hypothetical protein
MVRYVVGTASCRFGHTGTHWITKGWASLVLGWVIPNYRHAGCCSKVYPQIVAWEGVGEDTERSYSNCLCKISHTPKEKRSNNSSKT